MTLVENVKDQLLSSGSWSVDPAHSTLELREPSIHGIYQAD
jgi:hypothetical protein